MNALKAQDSDSFSDAIVVSFDGRWLDKLRSGAVSLVFRKRGPKALVPRWIYVYVGSPHSFILGRLPVLKYERLPLDAALKRAPHAGLSREELALYLFNYDSVAAFTVRALELARSARSLSYLRSSFSFSPPQSFLVLSKDGQRELDVVLGLNNRKSGQDR